MVTFWNKQNARVTLTFWVATHSLVVDPLGFNVYAITQSLTEIVLHCLQINA
jgi:hypothetical protein